jgi:chromosome segregation ATPase
MGMSSEGGNVSDLTIEVLKELRGELREFRAETRQEFSAVHGELRGLTTRLEGVEGRLEGVEGRLEGVEGRLEGVEAGLRELAEYTQAGFAVAFGQGDRRFNDHERRLRELERQAALAPRRG